MTCSIGTSARFVSRLDVIVDRVEEIDARTAKTELRVEDINRRLELPRAA